MSEIDDIFSGKTKGKKSVPSAPSVKVSSTSAPSVKKDKKKKRKRPDFVPDDTESKMLDSSAVSSSTKRPLPETVVDTSHHLSGLPPKRQKGEKSRDESKPKPVKASANVDDDVAFKDSRGTSDRRKTEEGWLVYKEDELGIGDEGGDTPLCPFDCNCSAFLFFPPGSFEASRIASSDCEEVKFEPTLNAPIDMNLQIAVLSGDAWQKL